MLPAPRRCKALRTGKRQIIDAAFRARLSSRFAHDSEAPCIPVTPWPRPRVPRHGVRRGGGRGRAALHRHRDDEARPPGRPAALAGRHRGRLRPHRDRPRRGHAQHRPVARAGRGRRAPPAHVEPGLRLAAALRPGRPDARLPLDSRRLVAGVGARPRGRRGAQAHVARDRSRRLRVARRKAPRARERGVPRVRRGRRLQREEARRGREALHGAGLRRAALPPLGHLGRRASQPRAVPGARGRRARRPHARRRRRPALQPRRRGLGRGTRRQRAVRGAEGREGRGLAHERRALPDPGDRGPGPAHLRLARLRQRLPLQPRRALPRLAHAAARGLRGRSLAARRLRPGERRRSARSPSPSTARSTRWCSRPTRRRSTSRPRTRASRRCSRCRWPEGPSRRSSPVRARSATWACRATARRSSPRKRR